MTNEQGSPNRPPAIVMKINVNGLGVVRSLGREGVRIVGVDYRKEADGIFNSKYCDKIVMVADPIKKPEIAIQSLLEIGERLGARPFLISASDLFVEFVSEHREQLADQFIFAMPGKETIRMILSKESQYKFAQEHGIPVAKTYYPKSLEEVRSIAEELAYPAYIKPFSSALWARDFQAKGLRAKSPEELVHGYERAAAAHQDVIIQEIIPGPATNLITTSGYFRKGGEPVAVFQHRKIRQYPVDFGMGTLTETCKDEIAWQQSLDFIRLVGFQGICEVELKKDERDGIYKLIEINPRTWTQISQTSAAGINLPYLEYCDLVGLPLPKMAEFKTGFRWWDAMNDYRAFMDLKQRGKLTWSQWLKSVAGAECNGYFAWDDLRPVLQRTGFGLGAVKMVYDLRKLGVNDVFRV